MDSQQNQGADIRGKVKDDESLLKKIQLIVPGFRGYRQKEDVRIADELLRSEIGKIIDSAISNVTEARQNAINFNKFATLNFLSNSISLLQTMRGDIVHGEQGYSGYTAPIKVSDDVLNKIYEYDYDFVSKCKQIRDLSGSLENIGSMSDNDILKDLENVNTLINDAKQVWNTRIETVEGIKE